MQALDPLNNLNEWPLKNIDLFVEECKQKNIKDVNITGSNTDPLLHKHLDKIILYLRKNLPGVRIGLRTNGVLAVVKQNLYSMFDKVSISITSFDDEYYRQTMGRGDVPSLSRLKSMANGPLKLNVVLCPETVNTGDIFSTIWVASIFGINKINFREPYGQPHIGNPLTDYPIYKYVYGMPCYKINGVEVTYWDVHYVEVESVNLYANGRISKTYPVSSGHHETGQVVPQSEWEQSGRQFEQWKVCQ